jgi:hypothetical protein
MGLGIQLTYDAVDPAQLAEFRTVALGYVFQPPPAGFETWQDLGRAIGLSEERLGDYAAIVDPDGIGPRIYFQRVPEPKTSKNRLHIDVDPRPGADDRWPAVLAHAERLVAAGATLLHEKHDETGNCVVMQDPEGNEFCVH